MYFSAIPPRTRTLPLNEGGGRRRKRKKGDPLLLLLLFLPPLGFPFPSIPFFLEMKSGKVRVGPAPYSFLFPKVLPFHYSHFSGGALHQTPTDPLVTTTTQTKPFHRVPFFLSFLLDSASIPVSHGKRGQELHGLLACSSKKNILKKVMEKRKRYEAFVLMSQGGKEPHVQSWEMRTHIRASCFRCTQQML